MKSQIITIDFCLSFRSRTHARGYGAHGDLRLHTGLVFTIRAGTGMMPQRPSTILDTISRPKVPRKRQTRMITELRHTPSFSAWTHGAKLFWRLSMTVCPLHTALLGLLTYQSVMKSCKYKSARDDTKIGIILCFVSAAISAWARNVKPKQVDLAKAV